MIAPKPVHPFPARMAPELALAALRDLPADATVVDPMCGSGTVLRYAGELGHKSVGADVDPLAVLMAKVWTRPVDPEKVRQLMHRVLDEAAPGGRSAAVLPWIDDDVETADFVRYWFGEEQQQSLRPLALALHTLVEVEADILRLALSRIIVTKERGASLARDVSHSRPHKVRESSDYDVVSGFRLAVEQILRALEATPPSGNAQVLNEDARRLASVVDDTADCVVTSPPYLNAIDYIRGHRLALVWLGHRMLPLRQIRSGSVGTERALEDKSFEARARPVLEALPWTSTMPRRYLRIFERYVVDLRALSDEIGRIAKPRAPIVLVLGNSTLKGTFIETSEAVKLACALSGMTLVSEKTREIPPNRRYLPPPKDADKAKLSQRMRTEVVLQFTAA